MLENESVCRKCGIIATKSSIGRHNYLCDLIPVGGELDEILDTYSFLSLREVGSWFFHGATRHFLKERLLASGWTEKDILLRDKTASNEKLIRGMRQYGEGAKDKFRARCLRCDILLHHELEIDLRFCKYCYVEGCVPENAFERYFNFTSSVEKMKLATNMGVVTYGYDPTMTTYFAYIRPVVNPDIIVVSVGNSPNQCKTEKSFRDRLINSGLNLSEAGQIASKSSEYKRKPTNREDVIKRYLIDYILLCKNTDSDETEEDD